MFLTAPSSQVLRVRPGAARLPCGSVSRVCVGNQLRTSNSAPCIRNKLGAPSGRRGLVPLSAVPNKPMINFLFSAPVSEEATETIKAPPAPISPTTWKVGIFTSKRSYLNGDVGLSLKFIGEDGTVIKAVVIEKGVRGWSEKCWARVNTQAGTEHNGEVVLPGNAVPAAVIFEHIVSSGKSDWKKLKTLVECFTLTAGDKSVTFPAVGYVASKPRVFFSGKPLLLSQTPPGLRRLRQEELKALQGAYDPDPDAIRKDDDLYYDYQTYNDLGGDITTTDFEQDKAVQRPVLGGSAELPYPRRIRTARPNYYYTYYDRPTPFESKPKALGFLPWTPMDDDFSTEKQVSFVGNAFTAALPGLRQKKAVKAPSFMGIEEILAEFDNDNGELEPALRRTPTSKVKNAIFRGVKNVVATARRLTQIGRNPVTAVADLFKSYDNVGDIFEWPAPFNIANTTALAERTGVPPPSPHAAARVDQWRTDEEFGRQYLAGLNPMVLRVMTKDFFANVNVSITESQLKPFLEGRTVDELLAAASPRLFFVDYHTVFIDYLERINGTYGEGVKVQHAGHCVLYRRNDGHLVPVAIDLTSDPMKAPTVYTPAMAESVWLLAKSIFSSIDSGYHQLISHWLRTHCCQEPYLIATRRMLSAMHPVYKLIMPHFRYTMRINANARGSLINADGVIEQGFTPGSFSMSLSATVYGKVWKFQDEALPADLKLRGFLDDSGKLLVEDYPYAEDGLLIWNAIEEFFTKYIDMYYKSDAEVTGDEELREWWTDIKTKGHADKADEPNCWPVLNGKASLVRILATMAWMGSAHHAAVNFGQFDYGAFMPGRSGLVRKAMPEPGSQEFKDLALSSGDSADAILLTWLADPVSASTVTTVVKTLTVHAKDEQYLSDPEHEYLTELPARELHDAFVAKIQESEREIVRRNRDPARITRNLNAKGLPYRYLFASSTEGSTGQGVPFSISI